MSDFVQRSKRSIELPLGCKDLIDVEGIRNWKAASLPDWFKPPTKDQLAYMEGYLARRLESAGKSMLVVISCRLYQGQISVYEDSGLTAPVVLALWNGAAQEQTLRNVFEEADIPSVNEPVGRWKAKLALQYLLPIDPSKAVQLIGEVFRIGFGLSDHSVVSLWEHEPKAA
jgi:hypothetical protein